MFAAKKPALAFKKPVPTANNIPAKPIVPMAKKSAKTAKSKAIKPKPKTNPKKKAQKAKKSS